MDLYAQTAMEQRVFSGIRRQRTTMPPIEGQSKCYACVPPAVLSSEGRIVPFQAYASSYLRPPAYPSQQCPAGADASHAQKRAVVGALSDQELKAIDCALNGCSTVPPAAQHWQYMV